MAGRSSRCRISARKARKAAVEVLEGVYRKQPFLGECQALQGTVVQYALRA
ncbi:MAG: hypothetical protein ACT4QB_08030 [Gammaproteobacteria bacterium]